jgi:hypothetical protein
MKKTNVYFPLVLKIEQFRIHKPHAGEPLVYYEEYISGCCRVANNVTDETLGPWQGFGWFAFLATQRVAWKESVVQDQLQKNDHRSECSVL